MNLIGNSRGWRCRIFATSLTTALAFPAATASAETLAEAELLPDGTVVTIDEVLITSQDDLLSVDRFGGGTDMPVVKDDTRAAVIYKFPINPTGFEGFEVGDVVTVTARVSHYLGLFQLDPITTPTLVSSPTISTSLDRIEVRAADLEDRDRAEAIESQLVESLPLQVVGKIVFQDGQNVVSSVEPGEPFQQARYLMMDGRGELLTYWVRGNVTLASLQARYPGGVPIDQTLLVRGVAHQFDTDKDDVVNDYSVLASPDDLDVILPGDANLDGSVDLADFVILRNHFGEVEAGFRGGDFNDDGAVDLSDFVILRNHFGQTLD